MWACMRVWMCMHRYMHAIEHACAQTFIDTYIHTYIHACMHAYIHTYMHTYGRVTVQAFFLYHRQSHSTSLSNSYSMSPKSLSKLQARKTYPATISELDGLRSWTCHSNPGIRKKMCAGRQTNHRNPIHYTRHKKGRVPA